MDDLQGRVPEAEDGYEALADLPDFGRNVVPRDAQVKVPVQVKVSLVVLVHQWLALALLVEEVIEEAFDLVRVHRTIEIRGDSRVVDPFSLVVWSALLVPLEEDRDSLLLHIRLPIVVEHPEDVSRHGRLLAKGEVDHGKQRPFALIDGAEEKRLHGALDIGRAEGGWHLPGVGRLVLLFGSVRWINHVLLLFSLLDRSRYLKERQLAQNRHALHHSLLPRQFRPLAIPTGIAMNARSMCQQCRESVWTPASARLHLLPGRHRRRPPATVKPAGRA